VIEASREKGFGQVFNIGSDNNNYTKKMILDLVDKHIKNTKIEYKKGGFDPRNYRVSFNKVKSILNYETQFTAEDSFNNSLKP
jgi:nucleoside-diphosphate-sugar epimerase